MKYLIYVLSAAAVTATPLLRTNHRSLAPDTQASNTQAADTQASDTTDNVDGTDKTDNVDVDGTDKTDNVDVDGTDEADDVDVDGTDEADDVDVDGIDEADDVDIDFDFLDALGIDEPIVDDCWGDEVIDNDGNKRAAVMCDFITPDGYKSTADVREGSCHDITEPSCRNKDESGICQGPFTTDGSIRTIAYPEVTASDADNGSFTQTFCARADVYADVFDTGYETSIANARANLVLTFTVKDNEHEVTSFDVEHLSKQGAGGLSGGAIGGIVAVCIVAVAALGFLIMRRRRVRTSNDGGEASVRPAAGSLS